MTPIPVTPPASRLWIGPLMMLGGGIAIGFAPIGLRMGLDDLGPQAIAFWRYVFAAPMLFLLFLLFLGVERRLPRKPNIHVLMGGIFFALDIGFWHWSLTLTSISNATFIVNLGSVCVGFVAWLFLKERLTKPWFFAVVIALAGAAALSMGGTSDGAGSIEGDRLALLAAVFVSGYLLSSKLARRTLSGLETIFWLTLVEIVVAGILVVALGEPFLPATLSGFTVPLGLSLFIQVIGQGLIVSGLGRTPTSIAGVLILIQPVVAAAVSWQLFNEPMTMLQAAGAALILVAVWLAQRGRRVQPID